MRNPDRVKPDRVRAESSVQQSLKFEVEVDSQGCLISAGAVLISRVTRKTALVILFPFAAVASGLRESFSVLDTHGLYKVYHKYRLRLFEED
jgi:hypothetical protein